MNDLQTHRLREMFFRDLDSTIAAAKGGDSPERARILIWHFVDEVCAGRLPDSRVLHYLKDAFAAALEAAKGKEPREIELHQPFGLRQPHRGRPIRQRRFAELDSEIGQDYLKFLEGSGDIATREHIAKKHSVSESTASRRATDARKESDTALGLAIWKAVRETLATEAEADSDRLSRAEQAVIGAYARETGKRHQELERSYREVKLIGTP